MPRPLRRRTWTFLGSDRGGRTAAVLYSLIGACKHYDIDRSAYLANILGRLFPACRAAWRTLARRLARLSSPRST